MREDTLPTLERIIVEGRHRSALLAAPVGVESLPIAQVLDEATRPTGRLAGARLAAVATACDLDRLAEDLLGDDLAGHMGALFTHSHHCAHATRRVDPMHVALNGAPARDGVWSMHLTSGRAVHPERFLEWLPALAGERVRSRGHFWVASRPRQACIWDGAGAQLSIGAHGRWGRLRPGTSLVFTGVAEERQALVEAFEAVLLTPAESRAAPAWHGREDGLETWLGPADSQA